MISIFEEEKAPKTWKVINLEAVCEVNPKLDKSIYQDDLQVSFVPMPAVEAESGKIDVSDSRLFSQVKKGYTAFQQYDVLFAKITPCMENGKMAIVPTVTNKLGFGSTEFHVLRPKEGINPHFIYYFVSSKVFRVQAEHNMTGAVGQRRVPAPWLSAEKLPLPPEKEQNRIVAKIEELFSELDKGIESLKTAQKQLKVYRQALLKHAFEGKLTEQWRRDNPDKLESAEQLLERIKQDRDGRYQQQLEEWKAAVKAWEEKGKEGKKPPKPKKYNEPRLVSDDEVKGLNDLPNGWNWVHLDNLGELFCGQSPSVSEVNLDGKGILYVTGPEQWNGKAIEQTKWTEYPKRLVPEGCIFITVKGAGVGKLFPGVACAIGRDVYAYRPEPLMNFNFVINSLQFGINKVIMQAQGDIPGLSKEHIMSHLIGLPGLSEQEQINSKIDEILSELQHLEDNIRKSVAKSLSLRQSILKEAFSGQLVPQDPNDEPACELLKRIAKEKMQLEPEVKAAKVATRNATKSKAKTK